MSPLRVLRGLVFGAAGGILGWLLTEFLPLDYPFRAHLAEESGVTPVVLPGSIGMLGAVLGLAIGGALGVSEGINEGTITRFRRTLLWFLGLGAVGGFLGLYFGQKLYGTLGGQADPAAVSGLQFVPQVMTRALAWSLIGLFLGAVFGVPHLSVRRALNGAIGGAIGGFLGGFIFQVLSFTDLFSGMMLRFLGFAMIGAFIGFFIALVVEALKRVWVKVLIGRNEGREFPIDTELAYIGRDELADVPVFRDPSVPKRMASLRAQDGRYALFAESSVPPLMVNGEPAAPGQLLRDGDAIQFGQVTIGFYEKASATGGSRPIDYMQAAQDMPQPGQRVGIPRGPNECPYCGMMRHPVTGECACTVPGGAGPPVGEGWAAPGPASHPQPVAEPAYPGWSGQPPDSGAYAPPQPQGWGLPQQVEPPGEGWTQPQPDPAWGAPPGQAPAWGSPQPATGGQLMILSGPLAGQSAPLIGEVTLGRDPSQSVPLQGDATASRRHARLIPTGGGWLLRDEGSANGTFVNGQRITEHLLQHGDVFRVGASEFRIEG